MNERKEEKRVTSIARKINLQNVGSMLLAYLWVDILVCIVLAAVMIYGLDVQLAGRFDITYARKLMIETSVWDMVYQVGHKGSSVYYLVEISSMADMVHDRWMCRPGLGTGGDYQETDARYVFCT